MVIRSASQEETMRLGQRICELLEPGDVVLLSGEMGAGKSVLARGIAAGLGIEGPVPSPSFTILNVYETGRCNLYHFDFYRLSGASELYEAGLDEFIPTADGAAVIEWPETAPEVLPGNAVRIRIETEQGTRRIHIEEGNRIEELLASGSAGERKGIGSR